MSFPRYPEYKDSGVEWLGEIPAHWQILPLWTFFHRTKRTGFPDETLLSVYRDYGVIPKSERDDNFNKPSDDLTGYQLVEPGNLVINKMKAWQGSVAISAHRGIVSPAYFVYAHDHSGNSRYLHFLMRSVRYTVAYLSISEGVRVNQWDLDPQRHSRLPLLSPPVDEQNRIATFLQDETSKIDGLVTEQERLIELLNEKRQATISHAVTKGLNPDAPMRDSGIEWLGEIPAHWDHIRLKQATTMIVDCPHETPNYSDDGNFLVIRTADVDQGKLDTENMYRLNEDEYHARTRRAALEKNDIVYGREGERWGHACLVPESGRYCLGQRMMQFRSDESLFHPAFLMWQLNAMNVYVQGAQDVVGATSPHVNVGTIRNFYLTRPSIREQIEIVQFLEAQTAANDALIAEAQRAIELLQERRSALISAAVTGKIDVRPTAQRTAR